MSRKLTRERWFRHKLALALSCTVAELEQRVSAQEYADWQRFYEMSPWGCEVDDLRFGLVLSIIKSAAGGEWTPPDEWFVRLKSEEEAREERNREVLALKLEHAMMRHNAIVRQRAELEAQAAKEDQAG